MLSLDLIIIISLLIIFLIVLVVFLNAKISKLADANKPDQTLAQWLQTMQQSVESTNNNMSRIFSVTNKNITDSLERSTQTINRRLDSATSIVADVGKELGKMNDLGNSMRQLQLLLQAPKLRGNLGEEILSDMLGQAFPKGSFMLQYSFRSGEKVDAAIKTTAGILPIDAKFPMENFQKKVQSENEKDSLHFSQKFLSDIKRHIQSISQKYILPDEGTLDFALMYVPSETIFYEIASQTSLLEFARKHRVYPVSPNTLYAHLQTILLSFEGQEIEAKSKQVLKLLKTLQKDYEKVNQSFQIMGKHLNNASSQFANTSQQFDLLGRKLQYQDLLDSHDEA